MLQGGLLALSNLQAASLLLLRTLTLRNSNPNDGGQKTYRQEPSCPVPGIWDHVPQALQDRTSFFFSTTSAQRDVCFTCPTLNQVPLHSHPLPSSRKAQVPLVHLPLLISSPQDVEPILLSRHTGLCWHRKQPAQSNPACLHPSPSTQQQNH